MLPAREPIMLKLKFELPKDRENRKPYGINEYSSNSGFVYKRRQHPHKHYEYFRVPIGKVFHLTYWYEIPSELWEPVDVYGIPIVILP